MQSANTRHRAGPLMRTMLPRFRDCGKAPLRAEMSSAMPAAGALPPPLCCGTSPPRLAAMKRPLSMAIRHVFLQTAMIRHIFVSEIIEPLRRSTSRAGVGKPLAPGSQRLPRHRKSLSRLTPPFSLLRSLTFVRQKPLPGGSSGASAFPPLLQVAA